jgi:hypothetical protein
VCTPNSVPHNWLVAIVAVWILVFGESLAAVPEQSDTLTEEDVAPRFLLRCTVCHGNRVREGDLDLRSRESILRGGKSGPAIVPGDPDNSLLLQKIHAGEMPPKRRLVEVSVKPMPADEIELVTRWIEQGAPGSDKSSEVTAAEPMVSDADRQWWAYRPPERPVIPSVKSADRVRSPIDAFILEELETRGLTLSPDADRRTLARRISFDLTGLPPSPEEVIAFEKDRAPGAYSRFVNRVLDSPRYGERWARHWLDAVGYSDSEGIVHADPVRPFAYRYRDYVIRAFNDDKPYDRFLIEQIAGDEIAPFDVTQTPTPEIYDNLVATGYLRMVPDGTAPGVTGYVPDRLDVIDGALDVLSSTVFGLTIRCARCHDHKFDALPQRDYYRLAAIFKGALDEHDWLKPYPDPRYPVNPTRHLDLGATDEDRRVFEKKAETLRAEIEKFESELEPLQQELAKNGALDTVGIQKKNELEKNIRDRSETLEAGPRTRIRALWDRGEPSPTYVLDRGTYTTPSERVLPGVPTVLAGHAGPIAAREPWPEAKKTGRRLALARWATNPKHPLTPRVLVNRVWKHHFEHGIVRTLDDFGKAGIPPTHPKLLDWLAVEFVEKGWSLKELHRLIMNSTTYRQSSRLTEQQDRIDPENIYLGRAPLRRLEAEPLRDTLLSVSGMFDTTPFGPANAVSRNDEGLITAVPIDGRWRRSIYLIQRRTEQSTLLENYDLPDMSPNCVERNVSIVAPQALHLLNNSMIHDLSLALASRVSEEVGGDPGKQIERVYWIALQREPTAEEAEEARAFVEATAARWKAIGDNKQPKEAKTISPEHRGFANLCHALMNSAEFLFVD